MRIRGLADASPPDVYSGNGRGTAVASLSEADAALAGSLDKLDSAHNYASWILEFVEPHLGPEILEVGAGHGTFTGVLAGKAGRVVACDISERCAGILRARFPAEDGVEVLHGTIGTAGPRGPYDAAVLINVLEHIEDDDVALKELAAMLKPGGRIILWVPALPLLYSDFDRSIGHYRRYRKAGLRAQLLQAGLDVRDIRYVNPVGALAWLVLARILGKKPNRKATLSVFNRCLVPVLRKIERWWRPPWGQSVFAVATVPARIAAGAPGRQGRTLGR